MTTAHVRFLDLHVSLWVHRRLGFDHSNLLRQGMTRRVASGRALRSDGGAGRLLGRCPCSRWRGHVAGRQIGSHQGGVVIAPWPVKPPLAVEDFNRLGFGEAPRVSSRFIHPRATDYLPRSPAKCIAVLLRRRLPNSIGLRRSQCGDGERGMVVGCICQWAGPLALLSIGVDPRVTVGVRWTRGGIP